MSAPGSLWYGNHFSSLPEFLVASTCLGWDARGFAGEQRRASVSGTSAALLRAGAGRSGRPGARAAPGCQGASAGC